MNSLCLVACLFSIVAAIICDKHKAGDVLGDTCKRATKPGSDQCWEDGLVKWNSTQLIFNFMKNTCCHVWDAFDCILLLVKNEAKCTKGDFEKLNKFYFHQINSNTICMNYPYYSSKCTITEKDIKQGTSDEEKKKLFTIPIPSDSCQDEVSKTSQVCVEKVAKQSGYNTDDLKDPKKEFKIDCCLKYEITRCLLDKAKATDKCEHQDANGLILVYEETDRKKTNTCKDYPYRSVQCDNNSNNNSFKPDTNLAITFLLILLYSFFLN